MMHLLILLAGVVLMPGAVANPYLTQFEKAVSTAEELARAREAQVLQMVLVLLVEMGREWC